MEEIIISAIQMNSKLNDKKANFEKIRELIKENITKTDIIILPEVWSVGWAPEIFQKNAEETDNSETLEFLSNIAKKYNSWIIGGSIIIKEGNKYYNSCPVINRNGELAVKYNKNHLYAYYGCDEDKFISAGDKPILIDIEGFKIGLSICYDIRFPEIYRAYRKAGADILVNCAAWGRKKPIPWECMTRSRAAENQCYMIALTQCGLIKNNEWNLGHSRIIDFKGETITEITGQKESIMTTSLNKTLMYKFREKCACIKDIKELAKTVENIVIVSDYIFSDAESYDERDAVLNDAKIAINPETVLIYGDDKVTAKIGTIYTTEVPVEKFIDNKKAKAKLIIPEGVKILKDITEVEITLEKNSKGVD